MFSTNTSMHTKAHIQGPMTFIKKLQQFFLQTNQQRSSPDLPSFIQKAWLETPFDPSQNVFLVFF